MASMGALPKAGRKQWIGLALLCLPTMLTTIDLNVMFLALPHIGADLGASGTQQLWMTDVYGFMIAGFLITTGTLGDRIGRRKVLLLGAAALAVASLLAAYSTSPVMLIVSRALIGVAGATVMPTVLATIRVMFTDPRQMSVATALWGTSLTAGVVLGPVVGGVLLDTFWWGSIFLMAVPITAVVLLAGPFLVPESRNPDPAPLDLASVVLSLAAILPLIYGLKEVATHGWAALPVAAAVAGAACVLLFVRRQRRLPVPLLDLGLFRSRVLSAALALAMGGAFVSGGLGLVSVLFLQLVEGLAPLNVGLLLLAPAIALVIVGNLTPFVARKVRPSQILAAGMLVAALGMVVITQVPSAGGLPLLMTGLIIVYLGSGPIGTLLPFMVMSSAPPEKAGLAGSLPGTLGEFGVAIGVAVMGLTSAAVYRTQVTVPAGLPAEASGAAGESIVGAAAVAQQTPGPDATAMLASAQQAFTTGMQTVAAVAAVILVGLAALATIGLRQVPTISAAPAEGVPPAAEPGEAVQAGG